MSIRIGQTSRNAILYASLDPRETITYADSRLFTAVGEPRSFARFTEYFPIGERACL